jgi:outer membrane protein assembly factor BamB
MRTLKEFAQFAPLARARQTLIRFAVSLFLIAAFPLQAAVIVGSTTVQPQVDSNPAGTAEAFKTTASAAGTITSLSIYVDASSTATKLVAGLYADSSGRPGALLTQGTLNTPTAGAWNTVTLPGVNVTAGASYWIAILGPVSSGSLKFRDRTTGTRAETSAQTNLSALPASWSTGSVYGDSPLAAYGSSSTSTQPILSVAPASLSFSYTINGTLPASASLSVTNTGSGTLNFSITDDVTWLNVTPASGSAPATLQASVSVTGLAAGTYNGQVTVTSSGALGSPKVVPVTLTVNPAPTTNSADWLMAYRDPERSGYAANESTITKTNVANLGLKWSANVDGKVTAQPLYAGAIQISGVARDIVIAATTANSVYAIDGNTGAQIWRRNFGANVGGCAVPGGTGIRATPVIDRRTNRVYAVSDDGALRTLSITDGAEVAPALGLMDLPETNKFRGGLNLLGNNLYAASGSGGCDAPPWRGRIYRVDISGANPALANVQDMIPGVAGNNRGGGIWGYGGITIDSTTGNLFAATGADQNGGYTPYGVRVIEFNSALNILGSWEPPHPTSYPCNGTPCDVDFGATPVVFQPSGCPTLVAVGNKNGQLYLMRANDLMVSGAPMQSLTLNPANDWLGSGGVGGTPAYWPDGRMLFITDTGAGTGGIAAGVVGLTIQPAPACTLSVAWSTPLGGGTRANSTPTVINGVVFVGEGNGGRVHAFDAVTGAELWNTGTIISGATYGAPSVAAGKLLVGSWNGFAVADAGTIRAFAPGTPPPDPCSGTAPPVLLGDQSLGSQVDYAPLGTAEAFQTTATGCGKVGSLSVYLDSSSTAAKVVVGLYADANGHPGALLGQGSSTAPVAGAWNTIAISQVNVTQSTRYWLAILGTQSGIPKFRDHKGGCSSETSLATNLTALPSSWSTGQIWDDCPVSGYGTSVP